jgi:hypothetical protein
MKTHSVLSLFWILVAILATPNVQAQTNWSVAACGNGIYNWSTSMCWSAGSAPTSGNVNIFNTGPTSITVNDDLAASLGSLQITGTGATITLSQPSTGLASNSETIAGNMASAATAEHVQTGGSNAVSGPLTINAFGTYTFQGGNLTAGSIKVNAGEFNVDSGAILTISRRGTWLGTENGATIQNGVTGAATLNNDADGLIANTGGGMLFNWSGSTLTNGLNSAAITINDAGAYLWNEGIFTAGCLSSCVPSTVTLNNLSGSFLINGYSGAATLINDGGAILNNTGRLSVLYNRLGSLSIAAS